MGREQKRKQAKIEGRNVKEVQQKKQEAKTLKPKNLLIILCTIVVFFTILYLITGLFITKDLKWFEKKNNETTDNQETQTIDNKILAVETLRQNEEDYYVYYYDTTKENEEITNLTYSLDETVYKVDLHDEFNSNYIGEPSGIVDNIEDLKVSDPTIIKVSSDKIIEYYSGIDEIKNNLNK